MRVDLMQGTSEWHVWRAGGLGASDCAAALGIVAPWDRVQDGFRGKRRRFRPMTPEEVRYRLWEEKTGRRTREPANFAMQEGTRREPMIRAEYERRTGLLVEPACYQHDDLPWLRASLDGITFDGEEIVECKYPRAESHRLALAGTIPQHYVPQLDVQLLVSGAVRADFVSHNDAAEFQGDERFAVVTRDVRWVDGDVRMLEDLARFWHCVTSDKYEPMAREVAV